MRILLFGMPGRMAPPALRALLALNTAVEVVGLAVPAPPGAPPVSAAPRPLITTAQINLGASPPPSLLGLAAAAGLPALALRGMNEPAVAAALAELQPDLGCVACWPWRLPPALLALPRLGWLNLHPSPLPLLRGPEPLFWALHAGWQQSAVTLHWMDDQFDTGAIALQVALELPEGAGWEELEERVAGLGASLLTEGLPMLAAGKLPRQPQRGPSSYARAPNAYDFALDPHWSAERAFRFMRGTAAWGLPYSLQVGETTLWLQEALGYEPTGKLGSLYRVEDDVVRIQLAPGVLQARLANNTY